MFCDLVKLTEGNFHSADFHGYVFTAWSDYTLPLEYLLLLIKTGRSFTGIQVTVANNETPGRFAHIRHLLRMWRQFHGHDLFISQSGVSMVAVFLPVVQNDQRMRIRCHGVVIARSHLRAPLFHLILHCLEHWLDLLLGVVRSDFGSFDA